MFKMCFWIFVMLMTGTAFVDSMPLTQEDLQTLADTLDIRVKVIDNIKNNGASHIVRITLGNNGTAAIPSSGWTLYFHSMLLLFPEVFPGNKTKDLEMEQMRIGVVQGDLYYMHPIHDFVGMEANERRDYDIIVSFWAISRTDFMPYWYLTSDDPDVLPCVAKATDLSLNYVDNFNEARQWKRRADDVYNPFTAQERFRRLAYENEGVEDRPIIPTPEHITVAYAGKTLSLDNSWKIFSQSTDFEDVAEYIKEVQSLDIAVSQPSDNVILLRKSSANSGKESYKIIIDPEEKLITLESDDSDGIFYAFQSLRSILFTYKNLNIPKVTVEDKPRYHYRGMHLDVARNFHTVDDVKRLMKAMAMYKMNKFHFHLVDDEGWRLEIPGLPELTEIGGRRCHDLNETRCIIPQFGSGPYSNSSGSGFYTVEEYQDILRTAVKLHIEVIPEFDMPGHSHAAIKSMEARYNKLIDTNETAANEYRLVDPNDTSVYLTAQWWTDDAINPCIESTYAFVNKVMKTIKEIHKDIQPLSIYHFGGDEVAKHVWEKSPICQNLLKSHPDLKIFHDLKILFVIRVARLAADNGLSLAGWEDGFVDGEHNPIPAANLSGVELFVNPWNNIWEWGSGNQAYKYANAGYKVIMSQATHLYFDHPQEPDPEERGLYWATRYTDTKKTLKFMPGSMYDNIDTDRMGNHITKTDICGEDMAKCVMLNKPENIIGMQGHLWSETVRTSSNMDYMIFPRMLAVAERAWHKANFADPDLSRAERDRKYELEWASFSKALGTREFHRLESIGVEYRIPPPGGRVLESGNVEISSTYPGLVAQYSIDDGIHWQDDDNTLTWQDNANVHLRLTNANKTRFSRSIQLFQETASVDSMPLTQEDLQTLADALDIRVKVIDNTRNNGASHIVRITLGNNGTAAIPSSGWTLYFHSMLLLFPGVFPGNKTKDLEMEQMRIGVVQGDLYYMHPIHDFVGMEANERRDYDIIVSFWAISRTDFMPYWYLTSDDPNVLPCVAKATDLSLNYVDNFNDVRQWKRSATDVYNPYTAQERFRLLAYKNEGVEYRPIIPTPEHITVASGGKTLSIDNSWKIFSQSTDFKDVTEYIKEVQMLNIAVSQPSDNVILLKKSSVNSGKESYKINIDPEEKIITLESDDSDGMFYAFQSLRSILFTYKNLNIPKVTVEDKPRYHYRGMHLDVARNFHSVDDIKRLMTAMAMYKMNKFHFHIVDDEGWRLEIPGLPELTEIGARRCHDLKESRCIIPQFGSGPYSNSSGSGFYTVKEYQDILRTAVKLHIEVIPEFDMPGHSHAAIKSMEARYNKLIDTNETAANEYRLVDPNDTSDYLTAQWWTDNAINPCIESTYAFVNKVMKTIKEIHENIQPLSTYHFGGDEVAKHVWEKSPICQNLLKSHPDLKVFHDLKILFVIRVAQLAADNGLNLAGWEDGFVDGQHNPISAANLSGVELFVNPWNNIWEWGSGNQAYKYANAGYKVIMSQGTHLYFDHPQEPDPEERGLYWATRYTDTKKTLKFMPDSIYDNIDTNRMGNHITKTDICGEDMAKCVMLNEPENIIGMQGQLWSETVRTSSNMDYMIFPRMLAVAERAWHKANFEDTDLSREERDQKYELEWASFSKALGTREFHRLESIGVEYRIPPPGGRVLESGNVEISSTYPGLVAQYSIDDGAHWQDDNNTLTWQENSNVHLRLTNANKTRFSRPIQLLQDEPLPWTGQTMVNYIADNLDVQVDVVDNLHKYYQVTSTINYVNISVTFTNNGAQDITAGTWKIYFYSIYGAYADEKLSCGMSVGHVNIVLYYFTPTSSSFTGIRAGESLRCIYHAKLWSVGRSDFFPNWYVASVGMEPKIINSTAGDDVSYVGKFDTPAKWKRTKDDLFDPYTAPVRYDMYKRGNSKKRPYTVIPTPTRQDIPDRETTYFNPKTWTVTKSDDFPFEAKFLADSLKVTLSEHNQTSQYIHFIKSTINIGGSEAYHLNIDTAKKVVTIITQTPTGALHAVQTFISLVKENLEKLPHVNIKDNPRFEYRGVMLDVSRNFKPKDWILKFLDVMSMYKLNKLHLHLSDDEGWRLEIPGIPELTNIASKRCHSDYTDDCVIPQLGSGPFTTTSGSGFYNISEYREILKYANDRHIEIIPELDIPGHSVATIAAMEEREKVIDKYRSHKYTPLPESYLLFDRNYVEERLPYEKRFRDDINPCLNSTYRFTKKILDGIIELHHPVQPLRVFHTGGDEVSHATWDKSPACNQMYGPGKVSTHKLMQNFVKSVSDMVADRGLNMAVWDDGVYSNNSPNNITDYKTKEVYVYPWSGGTDHIQRTAEFANKGYKVVLPLATHLYFDHAQEPDPESRGLYWATRYIDTHRVFGFQPDDIYANVDLGLMGHHVDIEDLCGDKPCPQPKNKDNIIGIQGQMWAETMRTEEQFHEMGFPRILALAERAWHKASWEIISGKKAREVEKQKDWEAFADAIGYNEMPRLEKNNIYYLVTPPGARVEDGILKANTRFPDHIVEMSSDNGKTWTQFEERKLELDDDYVFLFRSKTKTLQRVSRTVTLRVNKDSGHVSSSTSLRWNFCLIIPLLTLIIQHIKQHF